MKRKRNKTILKQIEIQDIAAEGKALTRYENLVIFVKNAVPGDVADLLITKKKKNFWEATPIKFHKYSELRTDPKCKHFGICGGCKWQNLPYEEQLKFKEKQVKDHLERIAKVPYEEFYPIMGSEKIYFYRNKLELTFSSRRWFVEKDEFETAKTSKALGFHVPGMFDRVLNIEECLLQHPFSNEIINKVRDFTIKNKLHYYDTRSHKGFLRNIIIRNNLKEEFMITVIFAREEEENIKMVLDFIKDNFTPKVVSIYYIINEKLNDSYFDLTPIHYFGEKVIYEEIGNLKFAISPKSFFQTNTLQAYKMYSKALEFAELQGNEIVYDLYTGTGTIALYFAQKVKKVIGIEIIEEAIADARNNAQLNNIKNSEFFVGDVKDILTDEFFKEKGKPDIIILDPPRAGVHKDVIKQILQVKPKKIVYISCNPATQARDINLLSSEYNLQKVQPVDMFPHTHHIENIALLKLKN